MGHHSGGGQNYTASDALNDALVRAGVSHVFLNSGTDYPPVVESWAKFESLGLKKPEVIISPHESVALSAAQGFAQVTGRAQAVFVHVDVGTQNLGGALHNAYRCRIPVFIMAGLSPFTMEGELKGGRDSGIQFMQNVADQAGIVRGYTKLNCELKSGKNTQQMVYRALQIAKSDPQGPVYMMAPREVLEEEGWDVNADLNTWSPVSPAGLDNDSVEALIGALVRAANPLIITSYLGRNTDAVAELVKFCEKLAIPVLENSRRYMNFPSNHPMHMGSSAQELIKKADIILVIDCDVPWIPVDTKLREGCRIFYLDVDPIKEAIPLWHIPAERFIKADSFSSLKQLNEKLNQEPGLLNQALISERYEKINLQHIQMHEQWRNEEKMSSLMTSTYIMMCVRDIIDEDTIIMNESLSSGMAAERYLQRTKPGTYFGCGGSSLGWVGGASIGAKLACPDKDVVALASDGVYIFSCPTAVYWMARRYNAPFLTVISNNSGWNAVKSSTARQHPDGHAVKDNKYWASFEPSARLDLVAEAAGGAFARTVSEPEDLKAVLREAKDAVKSGIPAVVNVLLPPI